VTPRWIALLLIASLALPVDARAQHAPQRIIFDTDMGNDVDDALALAVFHALESRGECRLLAVTLTKDEPYAAAYVDIVNTFYGRGDIPIGVARSGVTPDTNFEATVARMRRANGTPLYAHDLRDGRRAPDAVSILRRVLAAQPDSSVVIVQTGFSTNLARLVASPADRHSSLSGRELVAMARDEIVYGVADRPRDEVADCREAPHAAHVPCDAQTCGRADEQGTVTRWLLDPDHGIDTGQLGMPRAEPRADVAVERRELQRVRALVAQDELDAGRAKPARAVVEEQRPITA